MLNLIPIDRDTHLSGVRRLLKQCQTLKAQDKLFIIYPEGTRGHKNEISTFKPGAAFLASKLQVPIVPVAIKGTLSALPKWKTIVRPRKISLSFLQSIDNTDFAQYSTCQHEKYRLITEEVERRIRGRFAALWLSYCFQS